MTEKTVQDRLLEELFFQLGKHEGALPASWSRMSLLKRCPRQWDMRYRKKLKESALPAASITDLTRVRAGTAIHWVLEKTVRGAADLCRDPSQIYDHFFSHAYASEEDERVRDRLESLRMPAKQVMKRVVGFAGTGTKFHTEKKLRISRKGRPLSGGSWSDTGWTGVVDLEIERPRSLLILDYKSESYSEEKERSTRLQTGMYAYAEMLRLPGLLEVNTGCAYLMSNDIRLDTPFRREDFQELQKQILTLYSEYLDLLESGTTEAKPSEYCKYCCFAKDCPALVEMTDGTKSDKKVEAGEEPQTRRCEAAVAEGNSAGVVNASPAHKS